MSDDLEDRIDPIGKRYALGTGILIGSIGAAAFITSYFVPEYKRELIVAAVASIPAAAVGSDVVYALYMRLKRKSE